MKNFKLFLVAAFALVSFAACGGGDGDGGGDNPQPGGSTVVGDWQLTDWAGAKNISVYISFKADGSFVLYQRLNTATYEQYTGSYTYSGNNLSGKYSDGTDWATHYTVKLSGNNMTLTGANSADVAVYTKTAIPEEVLLGSAVPQSRAEGFRAL